MNSKIETVLERIEKEGFEAYIVGGYVRDFLLENKSTDIDIITNALPKDLVNIFENGIVSKELYGSFKLRNDKLTFDITTYRKESAYESRRPTKVEYVNNLIIDLHRRDFTMNSLVMNKDGEILDLLDGKKDIENKVIRVIGDARAKLKEDPLRILRAIRFATILSFTLEKDLYIAIRENAHLVATLSYDRKKEELSRILNSCNALIGLDLLEKCNLLKYLEISYETVVKVNDLSGMWSQLKVSPNYHFTKQEKENIKIIRNILSYGTIDNEIVFKNGLYYSGVAGNILGIDIVTINEIYKNLPIKNIKDINITSNEVLSALNIKPSIIIKEIYADLAKAILNGNLKNEKEDIIKYIKRKW